jgi:hypothetical protein
MLSDLSCYSCKYSQIIRKCTVAVSRVTYTGVRNGNSQSFANLYISKHYPALTVDDNNCEDGDSKESIHL